jgi:hypothetical protein
VTTGTLSETGGGVSVVVSRIGSVEGSGITDSPCISAGVSGSGSSGSSEAGVSTGASPTMVPEFVSMPSSASGSVSSIGTIGGVPGISSTGVVGGGV